MSKPGYEDVLVEPDRWLTDLQRRWLRPRGVVARCVHTMLYWVTWLSVRLVFRFAVKGRGHLPASGPFIVAPNHASPLDPQVLTAGLPLKFMRHAYWAGKESTVLRTRIRRMLSWFTQIIPITSDTTALAPAVKILERGENLIWFPEGVRSRDGELGEFKTGVVWLLTKCDVPVIPVYIQGGHEACPDSSSWPRLRTRVVVRIGPPMTRERLGLTNASVEDIDRSVAELQQSVSRLRESAT